MSFFCVFIKALHDGRTDPGCLTPQRKSASSCGQNTQPMLHLASVAKTQQRHKLIPVKEAKKEEDNGVGRSAPHQQVPVSLGTQYAGPFRPPSSHSSSQPLSGGVACCFPFPPGAHPLYPKIQCYMTDMTPTSASKRPFSIQPCSDSSLLPPVDHHTSSSLGQLQCGGSVHSINGSLVRKGSTGPVSAEVVCVLELGSEELLEVAQILDGTDEVVMALEYGHTNSSLLHKGACKTTNMIEGIYIGLPFKRKGVIMASVQKEGATSALIQSEDAMATRCWFFPLKHCAPEMYDWSRSLLASLLRRTKVICYDGHQLARTLLDHFQFTFECKEWIHWTFLDTLVGSWLLDPDHPPQRFSEVLSRVGLDDATGKDVPGSNMSELQMQMLAAVMNMLQHMLQKEDLWELFVTVEVKMIPILAAMEVFGVQINCHKLLHFAQALKSRISKVESEVHKAAGHAFSINSTAQLRQVLFDELHLDEKCGHQLNRTQVHKFMSTSEEVLTQLQGFHLLPKLVLEYRQLCKVNAAFVQGTISHISEGLIRPCWQHTGTATGRVSSTNPNIQAFPRDALELGVVKEQYIVGKVQEQVMINVREIVQSRDGYTFLAADFRSIELRLIAHLSGDQHLIAMLLSSGKGSVDVFTLLASEWLGIPLENAQSSDREKTKRVVYAVIYGIGKERLGSMLQTSPDHAKALMDSFLAKFPAIKSYMNETISHCKKVGSVSTICKRKRWFPSINSTNPNLRAHSERQAVNFPVQGSAADICKCGMIQVVHMLAEKSPRTRLLIQIHDELVFEVPDDEMQAISGLIKAGLELPLLPIAEYLKVPLEVRLTTGKNWAAMSDVKGCHSVN